MRLIETARLRLRSFRWDDLDDFHSQVYSDPDVTRFLPVGVPLSREGTQKKIEFARDHERQHGFSLWVMEDKVTHQFIGQCGLIYIPGADEPEVEIAYSIGKAFWGKGYTSEAAAAALRYGFETAGLERIVGMTGQDNIGSQRVMEKNGMRHLGLTERYYDHSPLVFYQLDRADWQPDSAPYHLAA